MLSDVARETNDKDMLNLPRKFEEHILLLRKKDVHCSTIHMKELTKVYKAHKNSHLYDQLTS